MTPFTSSFRRTASDSLRFSVTAVALSSNSAIASLPLSSSTKSSGGGVRVFELGIDQSMRQNRAVAKR